MSSVVALAIALYSTSLLERETMGFFLVHHEIRFDLKKTTKPPILLRLSEQPAQSTFEKTLNMVEDNLRTRRPAL
jgi:hypothetical protein